MISTAKRFFERHADGTALYAEDLARAEARADALEWHYTWAADPFVGNAERCKLYSKYGDELASEWGVQGRTRESTRLLEAELALGALPQYGEAGETQDTFLNQVWRGCLSTIYQVFVGASPVPALRENDKHSS